MCGIGGRTIEEARRNMSYVEFLDWVAFRHKRGSLHPGMRAEQGFAMLAAMYANANWKGEWRQYDFAPHMDEPPVSLEDAKEQWK